MSMEEELSPRNGNGNGKEVMTYAETEPETAVLYSHNYVGRPAKLKPRRKGRVTMSDEEERRVRVNESSEEREVQNNPLHHHHVEYQIKGGAVDKDHRKLQRMLAKRQSARRTRLRKRQYALELEGQLKSLEIEMAIVPTRIKYYNRHNASLKMQCSLIEQKISFYTTELDSKRAQYESMMGEREVLTQLYMLQRQRRLQQQYSSMGRGAGLLPMNWNPLTAAGAGQLQLGPPYQLMMRAPTILSDMKKVNQLNDTTFNHAPTLTNTKPCFLN